jgi:hypothetical protein
MSKPWYREPWPWILMAGPFIVIIASFVSAWIAVSTNDGLVAEDYYKEGLKAGETLAQSAQARAQSIAAQVKLTAEGVTVRLVGRSDAGFSPPPAIRLTLSHPTRAGVDQTQLLTRQGDTYVGSLHLPSSGHWLVLVEDESKSWRLMASVMLPSSGDIVIGGETPADIRSN